MIAVDTNILVHAHRLDSEWNDAAYRAVTSLAEGSATWGLPWPCVHEFFSTVTHPRVFLPATTIDHALAQIDTWLSSPSVALLAEEPEGYWPVMRELLRASKTTGPRVHDARIAALCLLHGVRELWTADRDFSRFASLVTRNPLTS